MDIKLINISKLSEICLDMWQIVEDMDKTFDYHETTKEEDNLKSCLFYYSDELSGLNKKLEYIQNNLVA